MSSLEPVRCVFRRFVRIDCQVVREHDFRLVGDLALDLSTKGMMVRGSGIRLLTGEELLVAFRPPRCNVWIDTQATVARVIHGPARRPGALVRHRVPRDGEGARGASLREAAWHGRAGRDASTSPARRALASRRMTASGEASPELAPTPSARERTREELADYLLDIGATLASYGCPSTGSRRHPRRRGGGGPSPSRLALPTGCFSRRHSARPERRGGARGASDDAPLELAVDLGRLSWSTPSSTTSSSAARRSSKRARDPLDREAAAALAECDGWAATTVAAGGAAVFFRGSPVDVLVASIIGR